MSFFAIIALVFGAWMIVIGIPMLLNSKDIHHWLDAYGDKKNASLLNIAFFTLTVGVVILGVEYRLVADNWMWVIPLMGWIALIKGVAMILFPGIVQYMVRKFYNPGTTSMIIGLIVLLLGVFFLWLGFKVY